MAEQQPVTVSMLSERARVIFRDLVDTYLETGAPVGSRTLSRTGRLELSSATIRNVMQDLEELGLLVAPHTSAGRIPSEQGLRLFVDGMMQAAAPSAEDRARIEAEARKTGASLEDVLARMTSALSGLSHCAAIIAAQKSEPVIRQLGLVPLGKGRALAVLVGDNGEVENRVLALPGDLPHRELEQALEQAQNFVNQRLAGMTLPAAVRRLKAEMADSQNELDRLTAKLVASGLASWSTDGKSPVLIVRGQAHVLDAGDLDVADLDRARALLGELEEKAELAQLLAEVQQGEAMRIFIGAETQLFALSGSSVIAAPYKGAGGRVVGVVGVIGPTRLNYARVIPMVDFTANRLSRLIL